MKTNPKKRKVDRTEPTGGQIKKLEKSLVRNISNWQHDFEELHKKFIGEDDESEDD